MARIVSIHAFSPSAARLPAPSAPSSLPSLSYRRSRFYIFLFLVLYHRYCTSIALSDIPLDNRSLFPFHDSCRSIFKKINPFMLPPLFPYYSHSHVLFLTRSFIFSFTPFPFLVSIPLNFL